MTNKSESGIDLSQYTAEEVEVGPTESKESKESNLSDDYDELLGQLQQTDPILAMIAAQIFDQGSIVADLLNKVDSLEKHVGYLLSNDGEFVEKYERATEELKKAITKDCDDGLSEEKK